VKIRNSISHATTCSQAFSFGGSCLPKDLRAINYKAKELDVEVPVLAAVLPSNRHHIERVVDMVVRTGKNGLVCLVSALSQVLDDLRESPLVTLIETLIGKGFQLSLYDRDVSLARLFGANKEYIDREIPHISQLMVDDIDQIVASAEIIIIGKKSEEYRSIESKSRADQLVLDLVRLFEPGSSHPASYEGVCW
jgi:GDP-mannose 6-dehydrogenase